MAHHDPVSDLLTRIRNAKDAKHRFVDLYSSKHLVSIVKVLKEQGFIENFIVDDVKKKMRIFLKYFGDRSSVINGLKRVSKPGLRRFVNVRQIPKVFSGFGIAILSTPKGVLDGEKARKERVGGELLCNIW